MITSIIIVVFAILILLVLIIGFFYSDIKRTFDEHFCRKKIYRTLHYFVEENDELLVNGVDMYLSAEDEDLKPTHIPHILLTKKYVYVVSDFIADGGLFGNLNDEYLILKDLKGNSKKILNPVLQNELVTSQLENLVKEQAKKTIEEPSCFFSIVCYNDSLLIADNLKKNDYPSIFIKAKNLGKVLKEIEKDNITPIPAEYTEILAKNIKKRSDDINEDIRQRTKR